MLRHAKQADFFMKAYSECNEHLRTQPASRDQVILFYMAVCAFYLSQVNSLSAVMFWTLTAAMFVLGVICSLIVISFRSWIIQYTKAAEVLGRLLASPQELNSMDEITAFILAECKNPSRQIHSFFCRMGNLVVIGFSFVTMAPFAVICNFFWSSHRAVAILFAISAPIYFAFLVYTCYRQVQRAEGMNDQTWIIRFSGITNIPAESSSKPTSSAQTE